MKLLVVVLCLTCVVTAWPQTGRRWPAQMVTYQRTNPDIVALFAELGEPIATAIADKIAALGLDVAAPITTVDPATTMTAVKGIATIMLDTMVPAGCGEALALHMVAGFGRHMVAEVLIKNLIHTVEECKEIVAIGHIAGIGGNGIGLAGRPNGFARKVVGAVGPVAGAGMAAGGAGRTPNLARAIKAIQLASAANMAGQAGIAAEVPTMAQMDAVIAAIMGDLEAKLAAITPAAGTVHMEKLFNDLQAVLDVEALNAKPIGEALKIFALMAKTRLGAFTGSATTCSVAGSITQAAGGIAELIAYMKGGFVPILDTIALPHLVKAIVATKMTMTMGKVADQLAEIVARYRPGDVNGFFLGFFYELSAQVTGLHAIAGIVDEMMADGKVMAFAQTFITAGKTEELMTIFVRMIAMTLADFDLEVEEIQAYMKTAIGTLTLDTAPMAQGRFWWWWFG